MSNNKKADEAFKEDRLRFFLVADKYETISYLKESLSEEQKAELKKAQQEWRDMTELEDYPDIDFPLYTPSFLSVKFFSSHKKGE